MRFVLIFLMYTLPTVTAMEGCGAVWGGRVIRKHAYGGILFPSLIRMLQSSYAGVGEKMMTRMMLMGCL